MRSGVQKAGINRGSCVKSLRAAALVTVTLMLTFSCAGYNLLSKKPAGIRTSTGVVAGVVKDEDLSIFKGIPYGKPAKGTLRFAPPQGVDPWKGVFHATRFGSSCPQLPDPGEAASKLPQDEDCLTVNIWTPHADSSKRPVIVYLHGGAFNYGGSADPAYDGSAFVKRGNIVFASINYRVGAFGFLNLVDFGPDFTDSVNLGLQDQVLGLKWIKENIAHFGGDPDNITIMGESAGSVSVSILMTLPQARGLFHKAIAESGVGVNLRTKEQSAREARVFMEVAGVRDAAGLRALPVADILKAVKRAQISFVPVQDGTIIPIDPLAAIGAGSASGIPLLTGTNKDEFRYWIMLSAGLKTATMEQMVEGFPYFKIDLGQNKRTIMDHYTRTLEDPTSNNIGFALIKDLLFLAPQSTLRTGSRAMPTSGCTALTGNLKPTTTWAPATRSNCPLFSETSARPPAASLSDPTRPRACLMR